MGTPLGPMASAGGGPQPGGKPMPATPPPIPPPPTPPPTPKPPLPMPDSGVGSLQFWKQQVTASEQMRDREKPTWEANLKAYLGKPLALTPQDDTVVVNKDFSLVEQKKPQLFFTSPNIQMTPQYPGLADAVELFEAVVNDQLGPDGVDAKAMVGEVLMDVLCPAGVGFSKIGYEAVVHATQPTKQIPTGGQEPVPGAPPDPMTGQVPMQPTLMEVPNIISESYFWQRISPAKILWPVDFTGSDWDQANWLGFEFVLDYEVAARTYGFNKADVKPDGEDTHRLLVGDRSSEQSARRDIKRGYEIWYKAAIYDAAESHPLKVRRLVWLSGMDTAAVHEDSQYQRWEPDGRFAEGMQGFPVHPLTIRYVSDVAVPPSDCSVSRAQVNELGRSRTQMIQQRNRSLPLRWVDGTRMGKEFVTKVEQGEVQSLIVTDGPGDQMIGQVATASFPRENFTFNDYLDRDIASYWAMGSNQQGQENQTQRTATELSMIQSATTVRLDGERNRVLEWYVKGAKKLASLLQLFATDESYVKVVGPDGSQRLKAWDKTKIAGRYAFSAKPDSSVHLDAVQEKQQALQLYQMTAQDPNVNRQELLAALLRKWNLDPTKIIVQPPPPPPEKAKIAFNFAAVDLDVTNSVSPIVLEILRESGIQIPPQAIQAAQAHAQMQARLMQQADQAQMQAMTPQGPMAPPPMGQGAAYQPGPPPPPGMPPHGGPAQQVMPLSKHLMDRTGERSGPKVGI